MAMKKRYYTVNGEIIGEQTTGQERIDYLTDPLGNVTATVDQNAKVLNRYTYKPFGEVLSKAGTAPDPSFLWVGAAGFRQSGCKFAEVSVQARHYSPLLGQMIHSRKRPAPFIVGKLQKNFTASSLVFDDASLPYISNTDFFNQIIPDIHQGEKTHSVIQCDDFLVRTLATEIKRCESVDGDISTYISSNCIELYMTCINQIIEIDASHCPPSAPPHPTDPTLCQGVCKMYRYVAKLCSPVPFLFVCVVLPDFDCTKTVIRGDCTVDLSNPLRSWECGCLWIYRRAFSYRGRCPNCTSGEKGFPT